MNAGVTMVTNAVMPDQLGGLQRYVRELSGALVGRGVPVTIITKRTSPDLPARERFDDGVTIRRFDVPDRSDPLYVAKYPFASLLGVVRELRRDHGIAHVHYPLQGFAAALTGVRYVHTFHAPVYRELLPERRYRLPGALGSTLVSAARISEAAIARRASATIVLTEYMRSELSQLAPAAAAGAHLIPAGLDAETFSPGPPLVHPFIQDGDRLLFTARRLVPRTGVSELVRAMPAVIAGQPRARLAVAGDGRLRDELQALVADLGLGEHVLLLGRVSDEELVGWYRAASLFVLPTQELEGFGMSTVEALACGTPAVGTPAGATPEVLGTLDRRLIAASPSPADLASCILALLGDEDGLAALRSRARAHVVPRMSWARIAEQHLDVYAQMRAS